MEPHDPVTLVLAITVDFTVTMMTALLLSSR
jgi:hypothetical protein